MEAFLSAFIFIISVSAIFSTLSSLRKPAVDNEQAVGAALAMRNVLEDLRSRVDNRDLGYDTSDLSVAGNPHGPIRITSGSTTYTIYYNVSIDSATGARQVDANASWPDAL